MSSMDEIEEKIKTQVDNIFKFYDDKDLIKKILDFSLGWYMKGLNSNAEEVVSK